MEDNDRRSDDANGREIVMMGEKGCNVLHESRRDGPLL